MKVLYIPHGNIPSRWAHSFQAMKMAEALSTVVDEVTLLTRTSVLPGPLRSLDLKSWYGVRGPLRVRGLPLHLRIRERLFSDVGRRRFDLAAAAVALFDRPDLVYARSVRAGVWCARLGLRTVIEAHGIPQGSSFDRDTLAAVCRIAASPKFAGLVTVTEYLAEQYSALGLPRQKILVWPDAVDLAAYADPPRQKAARELVGLPGSGSIALYSGHLYPEKGAPVVLAAARLLPEVTFVLVGGWPQDVARLRGVAPHNVQLVGFVPHTQVGDYLLAADLLVLPNSGRGAQAHATSPLKLFEYMAAKRPIVASAIPAFRSILRHDENAYLVTPDDPVALGDAIEALLADTEGSQRLAAQAAEDVREYTWQRRAREILAWCGAM